MSDVAQRTPTPPGVLVPVPSLARTHSGPGPRPAEGAGAPQGLQLRHLRYLVVLADAGTFHRAAKRLFIAQSTLSQQIRRLEEIVGSPLLRVVLPWRLEESLAVAAAGRLQNAAAAAPAELARLEVAPDAGCSPRGRAGGPGRAGVAAGRGVLAPRPPPGPRRPGLADHQPGDVARGAGGDGHRGIRARGMDPGPRTRWPTTAPSAWPNWSACRSSTGRAAPSP